MFWKILLLLGIALVTIALQIAWIPEGHVLGNDSGLFAYIGRQILAGEQLYVDLFDHKTPGVYYLNALAFHSFGDSMWSIWLLSTIWILATAWLLFLILRRHVHTWSAFGAVLIFLFTLFHPDYFQGGNFTEMYSLLPQVLMIGAISSYTLTRKNRWLVLLGVFAGLAILFKPTYFGIALAGGAVLTLTDLHSKAWRDALEHSLLMIAGLAIPLLGIVVTTLIQGTLDDFWYAAFLFNFRYSQPVSSLRAIYSVVRKLIIDPPLSFLSALSIAAVGHIILTHLWDGGPSEGTSHAEDQATMGQAFGTRIAGSSLFFVSMALAVFVEWGLIFISGRSYGHYFIAALPSMSVCIAYLFHTVLDVLRSIRSRDTTRGVLIVIILMLLVMWSIEVIAKDVPALDQTMRFLRNDFDRDYDNEPVVEYITQHTASEDSIFVWDDHAEMYYLSGRHSPTRYLYGSHLLLAGSNNDFAFNTLLSELRDDPPQLILTQESSEAGVPYLGDPVEDVCESVPEEACPGLLQLKAFLEDGYEFAVDIGPWRIYQRTGTD